MQRSRGLDGIRGMAIALVLVWHYLPRGASPQWLIDSISIFWSGVDLFFVLSGFLIGGILLENAASQSYFSTFYIRRTARILPLYLVVLGVLGAVVAVAPAGLLASYRWHLPMWSYLTFTQNFLYAARHRLSDPFLDVTWSLAVEEQFYVFLSLAARALSRRVLGVLALVLVVAAPVLRFFASHPLVGYLLPFHRADALMLGVLLAIAWRSTRGRAFLSRHAAAFRWAFVMLLLGAVYLTGRGLKVGDPVGHLWLALFYGAAILLVLLREDSGREYPVLHGRMMEWLGQRSYGIYLLHKPVKVLGSFLVGGLLGGAWIPWIVAALCVVVLFALSEVSYRFLETPILARAHRFKYNARPLTVAAQTGTVP